jgi:ketosteroid isomerase-like protein
MTGTERGAALARGWIEAWGRLDMEWLRRSLAPDFVHTSPFGRLEGREPYLATVEPMARKSVVELRIVDVLGGEAQAAVRFENRTAEGTVESCDWLRIEDGRIREVRSFYDPAAIRKLLSAEEQDRLDGP